MIQIVICCGGGFSSSYMAKRMEDEIKSRNWEEKYSVRYMPFGEFKRNHSDVDVAMLCPHLWQACKDFCKEENPDFPLMMIPSMIYGLMTAETICEDAEDIIEHFKNHPVNPACFEGEDDPLRNKRRISHRRMMKKTVSI